MQTSESTCFGPGSVQEAYIHSVFHSGCQLWDCHCDTHLVDVQTEAQRAEELAQGLGLMLSARTKLLLHCDGVNPPAQRRRTPSSEKALLLASTTAAVLLFCALALPSALQDSCSGLLLRERRSGFSLYTCAQGACWKCQVYNLQSQLYANFSNVSSQPLPSCCLGCLSVPIRTVRNVSPGHNCNTHTFLSCAHQDQSKLLLLTLQLLKLKRGEGGFFNSQWIWLVVL